MKIIPYGKQSITQSDIDSVIESLQSDYLTQGPKVKEFEDKFAEYVDCNYSVAVSNGTAALHLSVLAMDIQHDEYVICSPLTFAASVNCVLYAGGKVLFADINRENYLIDAESIHSVINANTDKKIVGIIPVDFAGSVCNLEEIKKLADKHQLWIIEDACHSPGGHFSTLEGKKSNSGSGDFADLAVFSFHPVKHIATGEGGMITTNNEKLYSKLLKLRTHGITKNSDDFMNHVALANGNSISIDYPGWYMEQQELGYNYRIPDILCALGISQLNKAESGLQRRRQIADLYTKAFFNNPKIERISGNIEGHAYHLYIIEVENRRNLYDQLRLKGIYAQIHYFPVHLMPYYQKMGFLENTLPKVEDYYKKCISIPIYPSLTDIEVSFIIASIQEIVSNEVK